MKKAAILALALLVLRWVVAVVLLLIVSLIGWQFFLHSYVGLPSITLTQLLGFYCCVGVMALLIGLCAELLRTR